MLRIGFISYLNAYPFYYPFQKLDESSRRGWDFTVKRPGVLNNMLSAGALDVSLVSLMEYATRKDDYELISGVALSSRGYVDSVRLLSKVPMEQLRGCEIRITNASATSSAVMKILLFQKGISDFSCKPYEAAHGLPECKAALTIGDEALIDRGEQFAYIYDLGEIWQELFKCNVIFAVCAVRKQALDEKLPHLNAFARLIRQSPRLSFEDATFEAACYRQYPHIEAPMAYLKRLHFEMGPAEEQDMQFFFDKAYEYGLLEQAISPEYFIEPEEFAQPGEY